MSYQEELDEFIADMTDSLRKEDVVDQIIWSGKLIDAMKQHQGDLAEVRRGAVRQMRNEGMTLKAIGEAIGLTHQRVYQLEHGVDNKEKGRRR